MEKKINVAAQLKYCPKGMELDCTMYDNVTFECILEGNRFPIQIQTPEGRMQLSRYGCMSLVTQAKCVIFPKGKTTWEGFKEPFKDGDVVSTDYGTWIGITTGGNPERFIPTYCVIRSNGEFDAYLEKKEKWQFDRLATEEEKQKLFDAIKANGYKWNAENKTLEKLVQPKFKVGDRVIRKATHEAYIISHITSSGYVFKNEGGIGFIFENEHLYELVPNKFDITTLVPFESRVLVRNSCDGFWMPTFWGIYEAEKTNRHLYRNYLTTKGFFLHCIPYNDDTKHLLGTADDCDEFYKTWED